jgi:hypothetical protein
MHQLVRDDPTRYVDGRRVRQEETLHGLLIESLYNQDLGSRQWRGSYVLDTYHEMAASPPKPPRYTDAIDVLATRRYQGNSLDRMAVHWDVIEAKADRWATGVKYEQALTQLMKYVDFVARYHAGGNYASVTGRYVAARYADDVIRTHQAAIREGGQPVIRSYVLNPREDPPTIPWVSAELWTYGWEAGRLSLSRVA